MSTTQLLVPTTRERTRRGESPAVARATQEVTQTVFVDGNGNTQTSQLLPFPPLLPPAPGSGSGSGSWLWLWLFWIWLVLSQPECCSFGFCLARSSSSAAAGDWGECLTTLLVTPTTSPQLLWWLTLRGRLPLVTLALQL